MLLNTIRNVYCVGRNYKAHAEELGNALPKEPMLFTKPTHSLTPMSGQPVYVPGNRGELHFEGELVLYVGKDYKPGMMADEIISHMSLGIDFTLRDVQSVIKKEGTPWLPAKGFRNAAPIGSFIPFPGVEALREKEFILIQNGTERQRGHISRMIFDIQTLLDYCGLHYGLGAGDVIFTGTPEGVGPVRSGDRFELRWGDDCLGTCYVQFE